MHGVLGDFSTTFCICHYFFRLIKLRYHFLLLLIFACTHDLLFAVHAPLPSRSVPTMAARSVCGSSIQSVVFSRARKHGMRTRRTRIFLYSHDVFYLSYRCLHTQTCFRRLCVGNNHLIRIIYISAFSSPPCFAPPHPPTPISSWYYQNKLYSFGGVIPPYEVITNDIYTIDLSGGPPYEYTLATAAFSLVNVNALEARHGHDCKLVTSMKYGNVLHGFSLSVSNPCVSAGMGVGADARLEFEEGEGGAVLLHCLKRFFYQVSASDCGSERNQSRASTEF